MLSKGGKDIKNTKQTWFKEAKYGLFIHWGLYSILAGEYDGKTTPTIAEWIMNTLDIPVKEYEKLAKQFNPVNFDAHAYVEHAKNWGMKYLCITTKHHDGFALYHSKCSKYNVVDATPYGKDIIKELADACHKSDIKLCFYYSQAQDWHDPDGYMADRDNSSKNFRKYLDEKCLPQIKELLTGYGDIGMMWFDTPMGITREESQEIVDLVKSLQPNCIVSGRIGNNMGEYMSTGDNFIPAQPHFGDWEVPATLNDTWGFKKNDHNWKNAEHVQKLMLKIVSRGGNYLLNIGPDALGNIPKESIAILDTVGDFLKQNGDSVYATKALPLPIYDIEDVFFTYKAHKLFIHMLSPRNELHIMNIGNTIKDAYFLDTKENVPYTTHKSSAGGSGWRFSFERDMANVIDTVICVEMQEENVIFEPLED